MVSACKGSNLRAVLYSSTALFQQRQQGEEGGGGEMIEDARSKRHQALKSKISTAALQLYSYSYRNCVPTGSNVKRDEEEARHPRHRLFIRWLPKLQSHGIDVQNKTQ